MNMVRQLINMMSRWCQDVCWWWQWDMDGECDKAAYNCSVNKTPSQWASRQWISGRTYTHSCSDGKMRRPTLLKLQPCMYHGPLFNFDTKFNDQTPQVTSKAIMNDVWCEVNGMLDNNHSGMLANEIGIIFNGTQSIVFPGTGHVESGKGYEKSEIAVEHRTQPPTT